MDNGQNRENRSERILLTSLMIVIILTQFTWATGTLTGVIRDRENKSPLNGVNVLLEETNSGAATDAQGRFIIYGLAPGKYRIIVSLMGYEQKTVMLEVVDNKTVDLNITLSQAVLSASPITVTGPAQRDLLRTPQVESSGLELATSTVSQLEIEKQGAHTVIGALNYVPGALIETRGRKVKQFFSVRGQRYPYPEYSINGAWQREFLETSYLYPSTDIERIEIIRSSAVLLSGINGMAGIINIIPREYRKAETSLSLEYGTFGTYRSNISHGTKLENLSYAASVGIEHTDGPSGLHAKEEMMNFNGSIRWRPVKNLSLRYFLFHLNGKRELRLAESPAAERFLTELGNYDPVRSTLTNLKVDYKFTELSSSELLIYYTERDPVYVLEDDSTHEITRFPENDWEWGINLIHALKLSAKNTLRFSGFYNHWAAPNGKRFYYSKRNDLETIAFAVVDEQTYGALHIDAGLRWARTYINDYGGFGIDGSGKGFAKVEPLSDVWQEPLLQVSFGASYRFTNFYTFNLHLSAGQVKPMPGSLDINMQEPENETRFKLDMGLQKSWSNTGHISFVGFFVKQKDALVLSGETYNHPGRYMELYLNRDQHQYGLEFDARFAGIWDTFEFFMNSTFMKSLAVIDNEMQENRELPWLISSAGLYYQGTHLDVNLLVKQVSSFENDRFAAKGLSPQPLGDFFTLDLNIAWNLSAAQSVTRFYLEIKNLTNIYYSTVVGYPDFGRKIMLGLRQTIR